MLWIVIVSFIVGIINPGYCIFTQFERKLGTQIAYVIGPSLMILCGGGGAIQFISGQGLWSWHITLTDLD